MSQIFFITFVFEPGTSSHWRAPADICPTLQDCTGCQPYHLPVVPPGPKIKLTALAQAGKKNAARFDLQYAAFNSEKEARDALEKLLPSLQKTKGFLGEILTQLEIDKPADGLPQQ